MQLYNIDGWINFKPIWESKIPFWFLTGARGIGKTYGMFKYIIENKHKIIYLRRSAKQVEFISKLDKAACKPVIKDMGLYENFNVLSGKETTAYMIDDYNFCDVVALTTVSNLRSFDGSEIEAIVYDEFIPEITEKRIIKDEFEALMNLYETINRNRELSGDPPVKLICMANSNNGANDIFIGAKLLRQYTKMQKQHKDLYINPQRGYAMIRYDMSPISEAKSQTALYKFTRGTNFQNMAINNLAADIEEFKETRVNIKEFTPKVRIGKLTVYAHKNKTLYYVTDYHSGKCPELADDNKGLLKFQDDYFILKVYYYSNKIVFGEYDHEVLFKKYLNI